ncbi:LysE family translocator [Marinomonas transparens]|uniref:LysE family translocator n=1 Tax=Marinomonas transparens TaxID=2795388 RepID=A0A934N1N9_9GAMM|nr:LysE family translocator [Marinomonas transparens]MBJ7539695.1 LysE family translocator [Marinomonas transparens]
MSFETWLLFFIAYLVVTLSPGPNVLLAIKNAVKYGYKVAIITILMNLVCQLLIITSVAFGAGALLEKSPMLFFALKLIGGAYLIYLGITGLLKKTPTSHIKGVEEVSAVPFSYIQVCKEAFLVSASNPKTVIFLSAFLPQFISEEAAIGWQFTIMFLTICLIVMSVHLVYSYIAKNINKKWSGLKAKPIFSKITNSAFIVFGCGVLSSSRTA